MILATLVVAATLHMVYKRLEATSLNVTYDAQDNAHLED
jgi:hypothetical protein